MSHDYDDKVIVNLKKKIEALVEDAYELSADLPTDEQYAIIKRLVCEGLEKALSNIREDDKAFTEEEFSQVKADLGKIAQKYMDDKFSESVAKKWISRG